MGKMRRRVKWIWGLTAAVVLIGVGIGAALFVAQMIQHNRVVAYSEAVQRTNVAFAKINEAQIEKNRATVLFAFQVEEAERLQQNIADLSELSGDYFTLETLSELATAGDTLSTELSELALDQTEQDLVAAATELIELHGFMWQTDFLNLETAAVEELVESPDAERIVAVADEDVTSEVLEETLAMSEEAEARLSAVEQQLSAAQHRAESLHAAIGATLLPLAAAASEAPDQSAVVLEMYPGADPGVVAQLEASALKAFHTVDAKHFTVDESYLNIPLTTDPTDDQVSFESTDAWRASLIATHLKLYAEAVTAAWITDAGGIEEALGFNPFLPF